MAVLGDRSIAGLLSGLAEAPDFRAAASFLLAQLADLTGARRAAMFRLDSSHENAQIVAAIGLDTDPGELAIPLSDLSSPVVLSPLALVRWPSATSRSRCAWNSPTSGARSAAAARGSSRSRSGTGSLAIRLDWTTTRDGLPIASTS